MSQRSMGSGKQPPQQQPGAAGQQQQANVTTYTIAVKTSNVRNAGTDANVYVQLTGESGIGPQVQLKTSLNHRNKFERNHSDVFLFNDQKPLGALKQLKIWHDNAGVGPGWHLQAVEVNDGASGVSYSFPCNQWLDKKEGDRQLCRILPCARTKQKMPKQLKIAAEMSRQNPGQAPAGQDQQQQQQQWAPPDRGQQQQWPQQGQQQQWAAPGGQQGHVYPQQSYPYKSASPSRATQRPSAPVDSQKSSNESENQKESETTTSEM